MADRDEAWVDGPAGRLEVRGHGPADGPAVLFFHPLPAGGGSMGSRLVYEAARALAREGWRAYRFNLRGVGRSGGRMGAGVGEVEDALAVYDWVVARHGSCRALVGHSFGGAVALRVAAARGADRVVLLGTPTRNRASVLDPLEDAGRVGARAVVVVGEGDPFVTVADARKLAAAFRPPAEVRVVEGGGHFLSADQTPGAVAAVLEALGPAGA